MRLYTPLMFYWARKTGLSTSDASDLVQDVITQVFQKLPDFCYDASKSFRGWLRTITLNRYREIKRRKSSGMQFTTDSILEQLAPIDVAESVWDIATKWVQPSSNGISRLLRKKPNEDLEEIKSLLKQILAIETTEDSELKADLESIRSLLIFKSAKGLLEEIGELKDKITD